MAIYQMRSPNWEEVYPYLYGAQYTNTGPWLLVQEDFDVSHASQWTTNDGTWTWNTASSRLEGIRGGGGVPPTTMRRIGFSGADCLISATVTQAASGGLVARYVDQANYYLAAIDDDTSAPTANFRIWKRVGGSFTSLSPSANVGWARGTPAQIDFEVKGSSLKMYFNGILATMVTDTTFTAGGGAGFYTASTTVPFYITGASLHAYAGITTLAAVYQKRAGHWVKVWPAAAVSPPPPGPASGAFAIIDGTVVLLTEMQETEDDGEQASSALEASYDGLVPSASLPIEKRRWQGTTVPLSYAVSDAFRISTARGPVVFSGAKLRGQNVSCLVRITEVQDGPDVQGGQTNRAGYNEVLSLTMREV